MKRLMRRGLGWLLALTMLLALAPMEVLAAEGEEEGESVPGTEMGDAAEILGEGTGAASETETPVDLTAGEVALFSVEVVVTLKEQELRNNYMGLEYRCYRGDKPVADDWQTSPIYWGGDSETEYRCWIDTLPGMSYQCRVYWELIDQDSSEPYKVYGNMIQGGSVSADPTVLELNNSVLVKSDNTLGQYAAFTPAATGNYQVAVNGGSLMIWDEGRNHWYNSSGQSVYMTAGSTRYFRVFPDSEAGCAVTVSAYQGEAISDLQTSIQTGYSGIFSSTVSVTANVVNGSSFQFRAEYGEGETLGKQERGRAEWPVRNHPSDQYETSYGIPTFPGRPYWYRIKAADVRVFAVSGDGRYVPIMPAEAAAVL